MKKSIKNSLKVVTTIVATLLMMVAYQNCGNLGSAGNSVSGRNAVGGDTRTDGIGGNGEIVALAETRTAKITSANRVLDNMVSCLGTVTPNQRAVAEYEKNKGTLSEDGSANSVTSPMLLAATAIAGEVCLDLINKESAVAAGTRRIFPSINFNGGLADSSGIADVTRRIARSCWGRNETSEELSMIQSNVSAAFANGSVENQMLYLCSAMVASFSTSNM